MRILAVSLLLCANLTCAKVEGKGTAGRVVTDVASSENKAVRPTRNDKRDKPKPIGDESDRAQQAHASEKPLASRRKTPASLPKGLLLSYAQFEVDASGKTTAKPAPARLEIVRRIHSRWQVDVIRDPDSNVFHKAMGYKPVKGRSGILTLAGSKAMVKLWRHTAMGFRAQTLWQEDFGGRFSRMRDAEIADVYNDGRPAIVVGTHDQGVVAVLRPDREGNYKIIKLGGKPDTFIHEIEVGDLDGDNVIEVYATPSEPNRLRSGEQRGTVVRYIPIQKRGPEVVADLGNRHAKEIFVGDVDGDERDELYVAVEALTKDTQGGLRIVEPVEIRRYDIDTDAKSGRVVAVLQDRFCRFLTVGDLDGDGRKEMVAAAFRSGLWLLRQPSVKKNDWEVSNIDRDSSGFEHAAILADLDNDKRDELYVAADDQGELRRYTWRNGKAFRETIVRRKVPGSMMTWNIMPVELSAIYEGSSKNE